MGVDTKAIIRKGTTLTEIKGRVEAKYGDTTVEATHSNDFFQLFFKEPQDIPTAAKFRSMGVFFGKYALNDYGIDGVLISLSLWGSAIEIMQWLLAEFGGYLVSNDCDDKAPVPVNIDAYNSGKDFTDRDRFVNKIIQNLGYDNLKPALELFEEFRAIPLQPTPCP